MYCETEIGEQIMSEPTLSGNYRLGLRAGDSVEVRSADEILATLDEKGCLDALPFMPEMLQYCGRKFRVFKSAHKTCDTISTYTNRRMKDAVHLEGLRCDGTAHDGCQAACLLFWKEAWLKPVNGAGENRTEKKSTRHGEAHGDPGKCSLEALSRAVRVPADSRESPQYRCQATELVRATTAMEWWDPRQYVRDVLSRNVGLWDFFRYGVLATLKAGMRLHWRMGRYLTIRGSAGNKTPSAKLDLRPGELVRVRSKKEILSTLDDAAKNRGLSFDREMIPYCGQTFRVHSRVEKIIHDKNGKMIRLPNDCIILDGAICGGCLSRARMFCPRAIYPYWREIWLKRAE
jgi:hypothetical protein